MFCYQKMLGEGEGERKGILGMRRLDIMHKVVVNNQFITYNIT